MTSEFLVLFGGFILLLSLKRKRIRSRRMTNGFIKLTIVFVIGGPLGLSSDILQKSQILLSLSKMTFTHQMVRVILLEQIYRGVMIAKGNQYHY